MTQKQRYPRSVAVIGNYVPRQCGIATFTADLCEAMASQLPDPQAVVVLAMDDTEKGYPYPNRVKFEIRDNRPSDYQRAADYINVKKLNVAILQHEYGIFGGESGATLFQLLENLKIPLITTLHTTLPEPEKSQKEVLIELGKISDRLVVMSNTGKAILQDVYKIPESKIVMIPHGIPDVSFMDSSYYKDHFGVENRKVILTFGLLGPGKGLETMIDAMPNIIKIHPEAVYVILGATHPHVLKESGEAYRHELQQRIRRMGIEDNVMFFNQFVDLDLLTQFITAADVFVTPYPFKGQIVSGTLSYALGAGKAVVSTPYLYAEEMLAGGRGILVPFDNSEAMGDAIIELFSSESLRNSTRKKAYQFCRSMVWKRVAQSYLSLAADCIQAHRELNSNQIRETKSRRLESLPRVKLDHLRVLTDDTGILQHAYYCLPHREHGYCLDDVTRAVIAVAMYIHRKKDLQELCLLKRYLSFILDAYEPAVKRFHNFMSYERKWLDEDGGESAHGRAVWSLGTTVQLTKDRSLIELVSSMFMEALEGTEKFQHPRAMAFALIGVNRYLDVYKGDSTARKIRNKLANRLYQLFRNNMSDEWMWFEDMITHDNAKLPHALMLSGHRMENNEMIGSGVKILKWLIKVQTAPEGHITLIGNNGWWCRNGKRARFGQQPIEIMAFVEACAEAYRVTRDHLWMKEARHCFDWFLGRNDLNVNLYDFKTGGCYDGLEHHGVNQNMGAESTLAWLISLLTMVQLSDEEMLMKTKERAFSVP